MRILIVNDDGIGSPALPKLAKWAQSYGEVTVCAPKTEQSGKSQAIDFRNSIEIRKVTLDGGIEAYSVDSTPADCVRFGVTGLKRDYDLVLSGINRGYNLGDDIAYSGTIGAIFEASRLGVKAIALSTDTVSFDNAFDELDPVYSFIMDSRLLDRCGLLNVNFPSEPSHSISITRQGEMFYSDEFVKCGVDRYIQVGEPIEHDSDDISLDIVAVRKGYISITPLTAVKTDLSAFEKLRSLDLLSKDPK